MRVPRAPRAPPGPAWVRGRPRLSARRPGSPAAAPRRLPKTGNLQVLALTRKMAVHELYLSFGLPPCTPLMTLIMMDITMAKRSIMYDTNETYDSSKVVEVSRAVRWHEQSTLVSTSYGCSVPRGGYHTLFMTFVNDLEQKIPWVSYRNLEISSMGAQN